MSLVLLADDSPHALRMGEQILRAEGFEVVCVEDGDAAVAKLAASDPDVVVVDAFLPAPSGFDLCRRVKSDPKLRHVRVVLTAGMLDPFHEDQAKEVAADGILRKPFEASDVARTVKALAAAAQKDRTKATPESDVDAEQIRAAVTLALEAALPRMIDELSERVLLVLRR